MNERIEARAPGGQRASAEDDSLGTADSLQALSERYKAEVARVVAESGKIRRLRELIEARLQARRARGARAKAPQNEAFVGAIYRSVQDAEFTVGALEANLELWSVLTTCCAGQAATGGQRVGKRLAHLEGTRVGPYLVRRSRRSKRGVHWRIERAG